MREAFGDIWTLAGPNDVICITTNGFVKNDGRAVMGRGIALEALKRDPEAALRLGAWIKSAGNRLGTIRDVEGEPAWVSYPVKHNWWEPADPELIVTSAHELAGYVDWLWGVIETVWLPRPGCGNGRLKWEDVKPLIAPILDDRFVAVTK